jgi:death on curing protein
MVANVEPVGPNEYRNRALVDSAVTRPFQAVFGHELFPSLHDKAAALFHSLIADHPFENGNKRTAVLALDLFLAANGLFLYLGDDEMYRLAVDTASYVPQGISHDAMLAAITREIRDHTITFKRLKEEGTALKMMRSLRSIRSSVRRHPHNLAMQQRFAP